MSLKLKDVINGKYQVLRQIGKGAFSNVFEVAVVDTKVSKFAHYNELLKPVS